MAKTDCRAILRLEAEELSRRRIAQSLGYSRDTVARVLNRAREKGLAWAEAATMSPKEVEESLFPERSRRGDLAQPDFVHIHEELAKPKVSLALLYQEYREQCAARGEMCYCYSQFCNRYRDYAKRTKAVMRLTHKPGDELEVDWAGDTLTVYTEKSGITRKAFLFVACLPYSQLMFAKVFPDMKSESWLTANVDALEYIGGVPNGLVPDNLKTGVSKHTSKEVVIAAAYQDLAEYYGTVVVPTRVRAPRDKSSVERSVGICETWIGARLRNQKFFSFDEMNASVMALVDELNEKPFQKREGSRRSVFETEEKAYLRPLPKIPYEVPVWKTTTIRPDYLVDAAGCRYSVPYEYIGRKVTVRILRSSVDVFYEGLMIASHARRYDSMEPVYNLAHMPESHSRSLKYSEENCRQWAADAGKDIASVVSAVLDGSGTVRQKTNACADLMKLADRYSLQRLERACTAALSVGDTPSVKLIETLLRDHRESITVTPEPTSGNDGMAKTHGLTRGKDYYRKGVHR